MQSDDRDRQKLEQAKRVHEDLYADCRRFRRFLPFDRRIHPYRRGQVLRTRMRAFSAVWLINASRTSIAQAASRPAGRRSVCDAPGG